MTTNDTSNDVPANRQGAPRQNADKLRGFIHCEEGAFRALSARFVDIADYPARRAVGRYIWEQAQSVNGLKRRLGELPTGRGDGLWHPALGEAIALVVETPDETAFLHDLFTVVKPEFAKRYEAYLEAAVKADEPSRDVIEEGLHRTREQINWAKRWLRSRNFVPDAADAARAEALTRLCRTLPEGRAGTVTEAERAALAPFVARIRSHPVSGKMPARDPKWRVGSQPERVIEEVLAANGIDLESHTAAVASELFSYVREIQGAETLAQVLHEAPWEMPWEFFYDTARHCWDEVRHFEMGVERLEELGVDLNTIPVPSANTQARGELSALERYVVLVRVAEAPRFPALRRKFDRLRARGDEASAAIVDFDRSDEITHVCFGKKWMPVLRDKLGETRSIEQIVEECEPRYKAAVVELLRREGQVRVLEESLSSE